MAPSTRSNPALSKKIATLQLTLAPFVPLPHGPIHPAFPKTLLAFHLLTEDELDSLAHYYHQSTPGPWTLQYPATMNWDKDFLAKPSPDAIDFTKNRRLSVQQEEFLKALMQTLSDLSDTSTSAQLTSAEQSVAAEGRADSDQYKKLSDAQRVRIKRRKLGKFIGLVGMETPVEEIAGRLQASLDRAVERSRADLLETESFMLRRRKGF